jgi:hypothetical protein
MAMFSLMMNVMYQCRLQSKPALEAHRAWKEKYMVLTGKHLHHDLIRVNGQEE